MARSFLILLPWTLPGRLLSLTTILDTCWTAHVMDGRHAVETNPLMANLVAQGSAIYVPVAILFHLTAIKLIEILLAYSGWQKVTPTFARLALGTGLVAYWLIYGIGRLVYFLNGC